MLIAKFWTPVHDTPPNQKPNWVLPGPTLRLEARLGSEAITKGQTDTVHALRELAVK